MVSKKDCINLANKLIIKFALNQEPFDSVIKIDGEFLWLIIKNVFNTNLLPDWTNLDCIDETEEFQFILMTLEKIFDIDLKDINPAYLTMRKTEYIYFLLNSLYLANNFIEFEKHDYDKFASSVLGDSSKFDTNSIVTPSNEKASNYLQMNTIEKSSNYSNLNKLKNEIGFNEERHPSISRKDKQLTKFEDEFKNDEAFINDLICMKEKNFTLEISDQIINIMKVKEKSKEIKSNLNKLKIYESRLKNQMIPYKTSKIVSDKPKKSMKNLNKKKPFISKKLKKTDFATCKKNVQKLELTELLNKLSGLSTKQIGKFQDCAQRQTEIVNNIKLDLAEKERNMHRDILARVDKEHRILEIFQREFCLNNPLKDNLNDYRNLKKEKSELIRKRVELKRQLNEYYLQNLSNCKQLESEQNKEINKLIEKNNKLFQEDLNETRKEINEYVKIIRVKQMSLLDNYNNFYASELKLLKEEIVKEKTKLKSQVHVNDQGLRKHLEQTYKSRLYPKFN